MIFKRCLPILGLLAAQAQAQLFWIDGDTEKPVGAMFDLGTTVAREALEKTFLVRGRYDAAPRILGSGFLLLNETGGRFRIRFAASEAGVYSASLTAADASVIVIAAIRPTVTVLADDGTELLSGMVLDFPPTERGAIASRSVTLESRGGASLGASSVEAEGEGFQVGWDPAAVFPVKLEVRFRPVAARAHQGSLKIDGRTFRLAGSGIEPALPGVRLVVDLDSPKSAVQGRVRVLFNEPARTTGTLKIRLAFEPERAGFPDDPAISFASGARELTLPVEEGSSSAEARFQTGSTAGTLVFTTELAKSSDSAAVSIPSAPVVVNSLTATRRSGAIEAAVSGLDNTRTLSRLNVVFQQKSGAALQQSVELASHMQSFFQRSPGGVFLIRLSFPVTGNASDLTGLEVEAVNAAGSARTAATIME